MSIADYEQRLKSLQNKLQMIQQAYLGTTERAVVVLEGWDTAGKGGIVRRLAWALDPRGFKVHPISAPSSREQAQHYLQRFWERLPQHGEIVVFDRSWYGRVLVERVEQLAMTQAWKRAYQEINEFERILVADGVRLVKIFLHITPDEQILRFKDRLTNPRKRWKLSYEDFRNRERWKDYEIAVEDMMAETSTKRSRWYLLPANNKPFARCAALSILAEHLGKGVALEPRPLDANTAMAASRLLSISGQPDSLMSPKGSVARRGQEKKRDFGPIS
ncbi:MAG: polyphosphate kinase [Deltaproteobacteria bacterium]|nr:polyphosphate kinase [Deltaproteobacteria bacterium]